MESLKLLRLLSKLTYRLNEIPADCFAEIDKLILKFMYKRERSKIGKNNLKKSNITEEFKSNFLISKLIISLQESRQCGTSISGQTSWNTFQSPEINFTLWSVYSENSAENRNSTETKKRLVFVRG